MQATLNVKRKLAGYMSCLIINFIARLGWPWNRRLSLLIDRLDNIREGGDE